MNSRASVRITLATALASTVLLLVGCDAEEPGAMRTPAPATAPAAGSDAQASQADAPAQPADPAQPATAELEPLPHESFIVVEGQMLAFPPARVRIDGGDGEVVALLFSDDPQSAINTGYVGNSYYLSMPLEIASVDELAGAYHTFKAETSEFDETPDGIFLEGRRWQLQPDELMVEFRAADDGPYDLPEMAGAKPLPEGVPPVVQVDVRGMFMLFDTENPKAPPRRVPVVGELTAPVLLR